MAPSESERVAQRRGTTRHDGTVSRPEGCYGGPMNGSLLEDAFGHHVWATLRSIDACLPLSSDQLQTAIPGTYGSILETMRHLVGADNSYLFTASGGHTSRIKADGMSLPELRIAMEDHGRAWSELLAGDLDPRPSSRGAVTTGPRFAPR